MFIVTYMIKQTIGNSKTQTLSANSLSKFQKPAPSDAIP